MSPRDTSVEPGRITLLGLAVCLVAVGLLAVVILSYPRLEGREPEIRFLTEFEALGREPSIPLTVEDVGTGLKRIRIALVLEDEEILLAEDDFDGPGLWGAGERLSVDYDLGDLIQEHYQIQEGGAALRVEAYDHAFRGFLAGNRTEAVKEFAFDLYPPRLEVLSGQHYINQGGSEFVVYRVSEDAEVSGVQVGPDFFPGYPAGLADADIYSALFAFAYNLPADTAVHVVARDSAGNEATATPFYRVAPVEFRSREISVDEGFLQKVVPEIMSRTPELEDQGDLVSTYVEINSRLRQMNHETLRELSVDSAPEFLWNGAFIQLSNSQVESLFADRRTYLYRGETIDRQDHVGFDLSVVERYPIEAANDGRVILADYFGIYGNTVLNDHGTGLVSLYGHMSSFDVRPGENVQKGQVLGRSGATGLAGGDHLHFGLFLHGVPVNPIEWWDPQWIQDHVLDRLVEVSEGA